MQIRDAKWFGIRLWGFNFFLIIIWKKCKAGEKEEIKQWKKTGKQINQNKFLVH